MVKESSPANYSFLRGVEQVERKHNVILSNFLYIKASIQWTLRSQVYLGKKKKDFGQKNQENA